MPRLVKTETPQQKIIRQLHEACRQSLNKIHRVCDNLADKIAAGIAYQKQFKNSRTIDRDENTELNNFIITDPDSEEYCTQKLTLRDKLLGNGTREEKNIRYNFEFILQMRLTDKTHLCSDHFPAHWTALETLKNIFHKTDTTLKDHPYYSSVRNALCQLTPLMPSLDLPSAGQELMHYYGPQPVARPANSSTNHVHQLLKKITPLWVSIGCEPQRLTAAQELVQLGLECHTALYVTAKINFEDVTELVDVLKNKEHYSYITLAISSKVSTYQNLMPANLKVIDYLIHNQSVTISDAILRGGSDTGEVFLPPTVKKTVIDPCAQQRNPSALEQQTASAPPHVNERLAINSLASFSHPSLLIMYAATSLAGAVFTLLLWRNRHAIKNSMQHLLFGHVAKQSAMPKIKNPSFKCNSFKAV